VVHEADRPLVTDLLRGTPPEDLPDAAVRAVGAGANAEAIRAAAAGCRACDLWARATQTVFGSGPTPARLMLVGEQPGDHEDLEGAPFVGPAGRILDEAMDTAGLDRESVFVTNVVKHFKWKPVAGSKRRLHDTPNRVEVGACLPWVESELALVQPQALVLLGATAAHALAGPDVSVLRDHGRPLDVPHAPLVVATIHPSAILRSGPGRDEAMRSFVADLRAVGRWLEGHAA